MKKILFVSALAAALSFGSAVTANATRNVASEVSTVLQSSEWDKVLNDYEKYVNQYIATYKKAMAGDMTAMVEYAKLADKAQQLSKKLEKAKGDMNASQLSRYLKLTQKLANALQ